MTSQEAINEIEHQVHRNTDDCEMKISKDCYKAIITALESVERLQNRCYVFSRRNMCIYCPMECEHHKEHEFIGKDSDK